MTAPVADVTAPVPDLLRGARLGAFAVSATVVALGAHVAAGGRPAGLLGTLLAGAVAVGAGCEVSRRPRGLGGMLPVLAAAQLVQHELLGIQWGTADLAGAAGGCASGTAGTADLAGQAGRQPLWMLAGHALAVLLTAVVLAHGERTGRRLVERLRDLPRAFSRHRDEPTPVPVARPLPAAGPRPGRPVPSPWTALPVVRRGPPCPVC